MSVHVSELWLSASRNPARHCFRVDNCDLHPAHTGDLCCCCGYRAEEHTGCDCLPDAPSDSQEPATGAREEKMT